MLKQFLDVLAWDIVRMEFEVEEESLLVFDVLLNRGRSLVN
jgi:hypothetical protein